MTWCNYSNKNFNDSQNISWIKGTTNNYENHDVINGTTYIIENDNYYDNYYIRYNYYTIDSNSNVYYYKTELVYKGTKYTHHENMYQVPNN